MKKLLFYQKLSLSLLVFTALLTTCKLSQASTLSTSAQTLAVKEGKIIACGKNRRQDDSLINYDSDGILEECVIGTSSLPKQINETVSTEKEEIKTETPEEILDALMQSLAEMTEGCDEAIKVKAGISYRICTINNEPVTASETLSEVGDGIGFWFKNSKVVAIRYFHSGETLFFDDEKLIAKFSDNQELQGNFTDEERREAETLAKDGYQTIFQAFAAEAD
ncbi:hypothetical protein IQ259_15715 [Fortiea sp. LEGE XX443]|uniref:hypothetical protein n=1 Tax=Fortiea sp. LEGE XX443 TaxID=1828611 RepID=UPI001880A9B1|nr:hypothetical protein [Fortiea sp. LEGE XX443]MBE9006470.1 hypothetical protein [Fortiea sp. LEGE XX443]